MRNQALLTIATRAFYDWDGVVSDSRKIVYEANRLVLADAGITLCSQEEWASTIFANAAEQFAFRGMKGTPDHLNGLYYAKLRWLKGKGWAPTMYPGADAVIHQLVSWGMKVTVLSTHPQDELEAEAKLFGMPKGLTLFGGLKGGQKRNFMRNELDAGNLRRPFLVGDTSHDVKEALAAGAYAIGFTNGYHPEANLREAGAHSCIASHADLYSVEVPELVAA